MRVALVFVALALVTGVLVWIAAAHYERGVFALKVHSYDWAVSEFASARILVFPYRDAQSLEAEARRGLEAQNALSAQVEARRATVIAQLKKAGDRLEAGDAAGVLTDVQTIDQGDLRAMPDGSEGGGLSVALAEDLAAASRKALGNAAWARAGRLAAALLVLQPASDVGKAVAARARTGEELSAKLGLAKDAARRGEWRAALRIALAVRAVQKDFPGAEALVAVARAALAPKPRRAAARPAPAATAAASPTQPTGGSTPTTPPQPPPP